MQDNTETKQKKLQYNKEKYKRIPLDLPIAEAEILKEYCSKNNLKVNGFIRKLIKKAFEDAE